MVLPPIEGFWCLPGWTTKSVPNVVRLRDNGCKSIDQNELRAIDGRSVNDARSAFSIPDDRLAVDP
jgi:hypothetical protein